MELLLVRHGRPHRQHAADGDGADPHLTPQGRAEADLLADYLADHPATAPTVVYSSPMRRARQTAEAITSRLVVPLRVDDRLREFDHGAPSYVPLELTAPGQTQAELWRALETGVWGRHTFDPDAFARRIDAVFDEIIATNRSTTVAVVCHGGVLNSFLGGVLARPRGMFFQPEYTSVCRVVASGRGRRLLTLNETTHLQLGRAAEPDAVRDRRHA
ncbi:phosphoglycerate mutase [Pseudonocardia sulfidoxydans NBRC 16205]|uniref:Phosphoglycerate mutase n=1 Tax=Pseudonocardia sulfidoxydans NBRC 16205 TaxID=1223511 RepID=A0A511DQ53_9PSEU|nr:histidine phosphatase family protein [Pseudonocardia sulfidoxydans]GEL25874.1 phosphoglycerate mutase [Pseudonocardia sulfidoxydans NBRC 16205]